MALLGEMHFIPSGPGSWYNLPKDQGVAYAPQESWVLNATIRVTVASIDLDSGLTIVSRTTFYSERNLTKNGTSKVRHHAWHYHAVVNLCLYSHLPVCAGAGPPAL